MGIWLWNRRKVHLCVQTVAAGPFGRLAFRDSWPCRLAVAGEDRSLYVAAAFEASGRMREGEVGRVGSWKAESVGECDEPRCPTPVHLLGIA